MFLFAFGPYLAGLITPNCMQASIWCFFSIAQIAIMLFCIRETLITNWGKDKKHALLRHPHVTGTRCWPPPALSSARARTDALVGVHGRRGRVLAGARPLDRSAVPGSVRLRLARYGEPSAKPTLLYLSGGPGGAGIREFADRAVELGGLDRRYQLVSYDQRGTGSSGLIRCPALERDPRLRPASAADVYA